MKSKEFGLTTTELNNLDLLFKMLDQLEKDFGDVDPDLRDVPIQKNYFSLLHQRLSHTVEALLQHNPEKLMSILYRVDLPENMLHEILKDDHAIELIAECILKRELQKLVLRIRYSQQ